MKAFSIDSKVSQLSDLDNVELSWCISSRLVLLSVSGKSTLLKLFFPVSVHIAIKHDMFAGRKARASHAYGSHTS